MLLSRLFPLLLYVSCLPLPKIPSPVSLEPSNSLNRVFSIKSLYILYSFSHFPFPKIAYADFPYNVCDFSREPTINCSIKLGKDRFPPV